jgi:hypothetical protein
MAKNQKVQSGYERTCFCLPRLQLELIREECERTGSTVVWHVRRALDRYVRELAASKVADPDSK